MQYEFEAYYHSDEGYHYPVYFSKVDVSDKFVTRIILGRGSNNYTISLKCGDIDGMNKSYVKNGKVIKYHSNDCFVDMRQTDDYDIFIIKIDGKKYLIPTVLDTSCPNRTKYKISQAKGMINHAKEQIEKMESVIKRQGEIIAELELVI